MWLGGKLRENVVRGQTKNFQNVGGAKVYTMY